jgi:biotin carboxyl carrier protein
MYKAHINDHLTKSVTAHGKDQFTIDDETLQPDIAHVRDSQYHVIYHNRSYNVRFLEQDDKSLKVSVNGNTYTVNLEDPYDLLLNELGMSFGKAGLVEDIKAPMPGKVINLMVNSGEAVEKDQPLLILEAMKMENVLKAPADATIQRITVGKQDTVDKNQVLIEFAE